MSYLAGSIASTSGNAQNKMGGYKNEKVDALLAEAATLAADDPQRVAKAQEAQKLFREDYMFHSLVRPDHVALGQGRGEGHGEEPRLAGRRAWDIAIG